MHMTTLPMMVGAKVLLAVASPLQDMIDRPGVVHEFCNRQAVAILRADGFGGCADFIEQYMEQLNAGVYWADSGWKNVSHYYEPSTGRGLWCFKTALEEFDRYMILSAGNMRKRQYKRAVFFLGAAAHLVQDLCVPHHARAKLFHGHKEYEAWVARHFTSFGVSDTGAYREGRPPGLWLLYNAGQAADMLELVGPGASESSYRQATEQLLPLAQRTTAGFFKQYYDLDVKNPFHFFSGFSIA